jgi:hypothetical protein
MNKTILFLLVNNISPTSKYGGTSRSGLLNSATMTADQVTRYLHYKTIVEIVPNAEAIPAAINEYKPDVVILEAIWVSPGKVKDLLATYPEVVFVTRVHSEVPFLAHENNAISFIKQLSSMHNSYVAFNSYETEREFHALGYRPAYLPNVFTDVYQVEGPTTPFDGKELHCGCFGSIRPMKNQLLQAMMAALYCDIHKIKLHFHINATRVEQQGGCALGNMRAFFDGTQHTLVEHDWLDRPQFLDLVGKMDLMMQLSLNESFNIVTADAVLKGVPIIVSDTIGWMPKESRAEVDNKDSILAKMGRVLERRATAVVENVQALDKHNMDSIQSWSAFLKSL